MSLFSRWLSKVFYLAADADFNWAGRGTSWVVEAVGMLGGEEEDRDWKKFFFEQGD